MPFMCTPSFRFHSITISEQRQHQSDYALRLIYCIKSPPFRLLLYAIVTVKRTSKFLLQLYGWRCWKWHSPSEKSVLQGVRHRSCWLRLVPCLSATTLTFDASTNLAHHTTLSVLSFPFFFYSRCSPRILYLARSFFRKYFSPLHSLFVYLFSVGVHLVAQRNVWRNEPFEYVFPYFILTRRLDGLLLNYLLSSMARCSPTPSANLPWHGMACQESEWCYAMCNARQSDNGVENWMWRKCCTNSFSKVEYWSDCWIAPVFKVKRVSITAYGIQSQHMAYPCDVILTYFDSQTARWMTSAAKV